MKLNQKPRAVVRHEFTTIIKQPSFWISLLALPLLFGLVMIIGHFANSPTDTSVDQSKDMVMAVIDESSLIQPQIIDNFNLRPDTTTNQSALIEQVKNGDIDGLIVYPNTIKNDGAFLVFANNTDQDNAAIINEIAKVSLQQSLLTSLDEQTASLALSGGESVTQTYSNGKLARPFIEKIVPGAFLILFYLVLVFSVGYALTSIAEEKENRSIEMVLSYIRPQTLILGKLLGIILVTLLQLLIIGILVLCAYVIARALGNDLSLPIRLDDLTFAPFEILIGAGFLLFGFIFYVALMATIGAVFPSSKEASGFSTVFFVLPAVPFWGLNAITTQPSSVFTQFLTYFPLTAPTTALLRNTEGNLGAAEGSISLMLLIAATTLTVFLAAKAFRLGSLEYTNRVSLLSLLKK